MTRKLINDAIASLVSLKSDIPNPEIIKLFPGAGVLKEAGIFSDRISPLWVAEARATIHELLDKEEFASIDCHLAH